jgi:hypothetical protein
VRQTAGRGQRAHVVVGRLRDAVQRVEGQIVLHEPRGGVRADAQQLGHGQPCERPPPHVRAGEVAGDQAGVGLADPRHRLAGGDMGQLDPVQAAVGLAGPQDRQVQHQ